ncbi:unnamed protein product [Lactuca saligna]|uniref:Uncharacterized protein n=1 Tax=Lactuca saligna TaxID=75948 RepID=A0AA36EG04_LACSI|nr:unnamed protein product [Lactuca saligna]
MIHLASPLVTSPPATSGLPHYKSTNDKLILITEWFHSQLGVRLLHRTDDYECDSSTTPVIAFPSHLPDRYLNRFIYSIRFFFSVRNRFRPSPALHLFTKISLHLSTKIFTSKPLWWLWRNQNAGLNHCSRAILKLLINTSQVVSKGFCLNHFIERQVNQTIFSIYLTLKNSALNFFVVSNLSRPDLKQELLALGEQIGNAGSGLSEDFISGGLLFNMMIRVAAENQQACGNKSLYNDRVESFAAAAGEGQDRKPPSPDPEGAAEGHNRKTGGGGGKKKGKKERKIDPALLGFKSNCICMYHRVFSSSTLFTGVKRGGKLKDVAVDAHIRSYCWSGDLIRSAFSSGDSRFPYVHSNELVFEALRVAVFADGAVAEG